MSKAIEMKEQQVIDIKNRIQQSKSLILIDYKGLTVDQDTELRTSFRKADVEYKVLKNTLVKRALNDLGYNQFDADLNGPTAVAFGKGDEVSAAKIFDECSTKFKKMSAKSGLCDGVYLNADAVKSLASIPSKDQLLAGLASALIGTVRKLACGLQAVADQKEA